MKFDFVGALRNKLAGRAALVVETVAEPKSGEDLREMGALGRCRGRRRLAPEFHFPHFDVSETKIGPGRGRSHPPQPRRKTGRQRRILPLGGG
ncbi:MAG: hypothetical protein GY953_40790 [bacterium]|nr:hypothetical protein [bacterium]